MTQPRASTRFALRSSRTRLTERRKRGERGAALVEAAIVFLPLCLIVFGIIEYGFIFKDSLTISSATRAGARTASAEPRSTGFYDDTVAAVTTASAGLSMKGGEELFIYKADPNGLPIDTHNINSCSGACQRYVYNAGTKKFVATGGGAWGVNTQNACQGTADSVGVRLQISHDALTGFFHDLKLTEKTVMRLEPANQSSCS